MKKFTLFMIAAFMAVVGYAQKPMQQAPAMANVKAMMSVGKPSTSINGQQMPTTQSTMLARAQRRSAEVVTPPAGEVTYYKLSGKNSKGSGTVERTVKVIFSGADVYVTGLSWYMEKSWAKGTIDGTTATFAAGQYMGDAGVDIYLAGTSDGQTLSDVTATYDADAGSFTFNTYILDNGSATETGLYAYWQMGVTLTKIEGEVDIPVEAPAGLEVEEYAFSASKISETSGGNIQTEPVSFNVNVGFLGNDVYVQGLCTYLPEAWVKGTLADGKITFPTGQLFGSYGQYMLWFIGFDDSGLADLVFNYDATAATMTSSQIFAVNGKKNEAYAYLQYGNITIKKIIEKAATPATPTITKVKSTQYGPAMDFNIPTVDTEGNGLVASKLSYQLFSNVNGEVSPVTLSKSDFSKLTEDMTEIPYGFTENYDIYVDEIYLNMDHSTWNKIGLQSIYRGGGEEHKSEIAWYTLKEADPTAAVRWVAAEQGYANGAEVSEFTIASGITGNADKGTGSIAPKYYDDGSALRLYAGNTLTITADEPMTKIYFIFDTAKKDPAFNVDDEEMEIKDSIGVWEGNATVVTFSVPNVSGTQSRVKAIQIGGEMEMPSAGELVELPDGAETETWYFTASGSESDIEAEVEVAVVGNEMYIQGIATDFIPEAWVKGTISDGKVVFSKAQYLGEYEGYDETSNLYFMGYNASTKQFCDVDFAYDKENGILTTDKYVLINGSASAMDMYDYYSAVEINKTAPEPLVAIEVPENLVTSEYLFTAKEEVYDDDESEPEMVDTSFGVQIGFDGNDVYFQGLVTDFDGWAKGTLSADGKTITIPANQYVGSIESLYAKSDYFFSAAEGDSLVDAVFAYDAEKGILSSNQSLYVNGSRKLLYYYNKYQNVVMTKMVEVAATPADPAMSGFAYIPSYKLGYISFNIPTTDTDGNNLLTSKLSYQIMVQDDQDKVAPLTFTKEQYEELTEDMQTIPYNYSGDDISKGFIMLNQSLDEILTWKQIGVKSIYSAAGETHESNISWYDLTSWRESVGIADVKIDTVSTSFFDLQGRKVNSSAKGLVIKQMRQADGTVKTVKMIRK